MFKVIIVDDELWVCQLIQRLVNWEELGFEIVGEAHDGQEALLLMQDLRPDLAITDIRMPGLDGLSLIKQAIEMELQVSFIIVSGYSDFDYLKDAVRFNALDYLIKPLEEQELTVLLQKTYIRLQKNRLQREESITVKERLSYSIHQLRERFLTELLYEQNHYRGTPLAEINAEYDCRYQEGIFSVCVYKADSVDSRSVLFDAVFYDVFAKKMDELVTLYCHQANMIKRQSDIVVILNYTKSQTASVSKGLDMLLKAMQEEYFGMGKLEFTLGVSLPQTDIYECAASFGSAIHCIAARVLAGTGKRIDAEMITKNRDELQPYFSAGKEMSLAKKIELLDAEGFKKEISSLLEGTRIYKQTSPAMPYNLACRVVDMIYAVLQKINIDVEKDVQRKELVQDRLYDCKDIDRLAKCCIELLSEISGFANQLRQNKNSKAVEMVKDYIKQNYEKDISLQDAAAAVYLNPNYLSELFKKQTGINFSEYLTNYRIEKAKNLLKDMNYKTNAVANMVGYQDARNFSKIFKKTVGINPAEYRKIT